MELNQKQLVVQNMALERLHDKIKQIDQENTRAHNEEVSNMIEMDAYMHRKKEQLKKTNSQNVQFLRA